MIININSSLLAFQPLLPFVLIRHPADVVRRPGCTLLAQALNIFSSLVTSRLADAQDEISRLRIKCGLVEDYERKIQNLRDELYLSSVSKPRPLPPLPDTRYVAVAHYAEWFGSFHSCCISATFHPPLHSTPTPFWPPVMSPTLLLFCVFCYAEWPCWFQFLSFSYPSPLYFSVLFFICG